MDPLIQQLEYSPALIGDNQGERPVSFEFPFSAHEQLEAQQLLQQIGWTYYTFWKVEVHADPLQGLAWSRGDVNKLLAGTTSEHRYQQMMISEGYETGLVLQRFYQQCHLLPPGLGIAGRATTSRHYQWASGNELLQQINALSRFNHQPAPLALQNHGFQTIVCIPMLQKNAGVLEIGTRELVPEISDGMLSLLLELANMIGNQVGGRGAPMQYFGETELKQNTAAGNYASNPMQVMYRSRATAREPSLSSSSYRSTSSPSSSSPSLDQQMTTAYMTAMSPSPHAQPFLGSNEDMHMSPTSTLQAAPGNMVTSFDQLDILNQTDMSSNTLIYGSSVSIMPSMSQEVSNVLHDPAAPSPLDHNQQLPFDSPTFSYFSSSRNVDAETSWPPLMPFQTEWKPQEPFRDQTHILCHQLVSESSGSQPFPRAHQNIDNVIQQNVSNVTEQVKDARELISTIPSKEKISSAGAIVTDYDVGSRFEGKQAVPINIVQNIVLDAGAIGADKSESKRNLIMQMQGSTSIVKPAGPAHHAGDIPRPDLSQSRLIILGPNFQPWKSTVQSRMKMRSNINANRYSVKQILCFHLPRIQKMMNEQQSAARAANFVLRRRGLEGTASLIQYPLTAGKVDFTRSEHAAACIEQTNEAAAANKQHMFAERNRRRKLVDCISRLRSLVPNITKRDKITILERTVEYLKEVQSFVHDLQQQNHSLQKSINTRDLGPMVGSYHSSSPNIIATTEEWPANSTSKSYASCEFYHSSQAKELVQRPHFELGLSIELKDVEANAAIISIVRALAQKKLRCINLKVELDRSSNYLIAKIVAQPKDGESHTPTLTEIQDLKQWWTNQVDHVFK
ncbi:hypothetical protein GOP47_0026627 [Adiantum capillus-veneris]|nr:hypothetical protein GOP47_0026627 [Adiantum capillus-veneris]